MTSEQIEALDKFFDGLSSFSYVDMGYYDPKCMDYDGLEQVEGIYAIACLHTLGTWVMRRHLVKLQEGQRLPQLYRNVDDYLARRGIARVHA